MKMKAYLSNNVPVDLHPERKDKREIIQHYLMNMTEDGKDEHFIVCDIGDIVEKYQQWVRLFPRVKLFYAVKCNPDKILLQILSDLGASFDCASKMEIQKVIDIGVNPNRIIYTHTHKPVSSLIYAERQNVSLMTFDSETELRKIKSLHPRARLILQIKLLETFDATVKFGNKFGCHSVQIRALLQLAKDLELTVVGVSFHVGSGIKEARAYTAALKQSRRVFDTAAEIGIDMNILDIGGGFPGAQNTFDYFKEITHVNESLNELFPLEEGVDIIAEPGRYMVASAYTCVANITGKRWLPKKTIDRENETDLGEDSRNTIMYYVNDSVFGNFLLGTFKGPLGQHVPKLIETVDDGVFHESIIWGFACTDMDCLNPSVQLPELDVGDWLYFEDMGAYTCSVSTNFNGLETPEIKYYCLERCWYDRNKSRNVYIHVNCKFFIEG